MTDGLPINSSVPIRPIFAIWTWANSNNKSPVVMIRNPRLALLNSWVMSYATEFAPKINRSRCVSTIWPRIRLLSIA